MQVVRVEVDVHRMEFRSAGPLQQRKLLELAQRLAGDPYLGSRLPRRLVPKAFRHLPNVHRLPLPDGWRALYSVEAVRPGLVRIAIFWIGNHNRYSRLFGY